jgi:hypothetical protein
MTMYHNDGTPIPEKGQPTWMDRFNNFINPWARIKVVEEVAEHRAQTIDKLRAELKRRTQ